MTETPGNEEPLRKTHPVNKWSDTDLTLAVTASRSWRGVMRELGLCVTSAGSLRVVKRRVAFLGLDTSHFTGQRTWSDAALKRAAAQAHSWNELLAAIGIASGSGDERIRVKAHALRLGLDLSHLADQPQESPSQLSTTGPQKSARGSNVACRVLVLFVRLQSSHPDGADRIRPAGVDAGRNKAGPGQDDHVQQQERLDDTGRKATLFARKQRPACPVRPGVDRPVSVVDGDLYFVSRPSARSSQADVRSSVADLRQVP